MRRVAIDIPRAALADFCRRHRIRSLSLFGSVIRDDFTDDSDVDVLVEFEPGERVGYFRLVRVELELGGLLGRRVDLIPHRSLHRGIRDHVLREAEVVYG